MTKAHGHIQAGLRPLGHAALRGWERGSRLLQILVGTQPVSGKPADCGRVQVKCVNLGTSARQSCLKFEGSGHVRVRGYRGVRGHGWGYPSGGEEGSEKVLPEKFLSHEGSGEGLGGAATGWTRSGCYC